jgi:hypothetical protein
MNKKNYPEYYKKLSKFIVEKYTYLDEDNIINICNTKSKCVRTGLKVDYNYLEKVLKFKHINFGQVGNVFSLLIGIAYDDFKVTENSDSPLEFVLYFLMPEMYKIYYEPLLQNDTINENVVNSKKYELSKTEINDLLSDYENMGYDEESAKDDLIDLVSYLNGLNSPLTLYRIVCSDSKEELNLSKVGSHYSLNKNNLLNNHYRRGSIAGDCRGKKVFLITVSVEKSMIDVMETLSNNILYPHEEEITLKNYGIGAVVLDTKEL